MNLEIWLDHVLFGLGCSVLVLDKYMCSSVRRGYFCEKFIVLGLMKYVMSVFTLRI